MAKVTYSKTVSDLHVKAVLQRMADFLGMDITVHSGDRDHVPTGGSTKSLHLVHRAADFHVVGLKDAAVFKTLKSSVEKVFDPSEGYELILHGTYTATQGPHLHIGHYLKDHKGLVLFKTEGLESSTKGKYSIEAREIGADKSSVAKTEPTKSQPTKSQPTKPVVVKTEPTKSQPTKSQPTKSQPTKPVVVKTETSKNQPSKGVHISAAVGAGGKNVRTDVTTVQVLLNRARHGTYHGHPISGLYAALAEDGVCGVKTQNAINLFQKNVVGLQPPDGRVDPEGRTIRMLRALDHEEVKPGPTKLEDLKRIVEDRKSVAITADSDAEQLVDDPRVKALLEVLSFTEGTGDDYGKIVNGTVEKSLIYPQYLGKKNVSITDLSQHPQIYVRWAEGEPLSSAAGRYQFLYSTWQKMGMPDFSKRSQDIAAIKKMKERKMIAPLLSGDLTLAVFKGAPEWASLPKNAKNEGYYSGQSARTLAQIKKKYEDSLAKFQGSQKSVA